MRRQLWPAVLAVLNCTVPLPGHKQLALADGDMGACTEEMDACWDVSGNWRFAAAQDRGRHDDLLIDFSGFTQKIKADVKLKPDQKPPRSSTPLTGHARYAFDGKTYKLAEVRKPMQGI